MRQKMARMRRIPSNKERQRKASKKGGFDTSYLDDETIKSIEKTYGTCYWCKGDMEAITDGVQRKGVITMSCNTPDCPGNQDTTKVELQPHMKNKYAKYVDGELCFDLGKLLMGRSPSRLWATKKLTIDPL